MARYICVRPIEFPIGPNAIEKFIPGMIYVGDEPKCGKGTSLLKSTSSYNKKGRKVFKGPWFELIEETKPETEEIVKDTRIKAEIAFDILKNFENTDPLGKMKKDELLAYEQKLKGT